jgi:hypothetical protein
VATAPRTRLSIATCQVGGDFGFVLQRR